MIKERLQQLRHIPRRSLISLLVMVAFPLMGSSLLFHYFYEYTEQLHHFEIHHYILLTLAISVLMMLALVPTTFVATVSGFYLGWPGAMVVCAAYFLASLMGYKLALSIDKGRMSAFLYQFPKTTIIFDAVRRQSILMVILCRISPVLPFALMNFILAMIRVPLGIFLSAGFVGMLPRTLLFVWLGIQFNNLLAAYQAGRSPEGLIISLSLTLCSIVGLTYIFRKAWKRASP